MKRLNQFPNAHEMRWLESLIQMPNLISDLLVILDCPLDSVELESQSFLDFGENKLRFQVMTAGYKDPSFEPGVFTSCLAELLENANDPVNRMRRKNFVTTGWLIGELSCTNCLSGQEMKPSLLKNTVEDDYLAHIVLEPMGIPFLEPGSHHELSRHEQAKLFNDTLSIYENGLTEVFKVQMFKRPQEANKTNEVVSAFISCLYRQMFLTCSLDHSCH